MRITALWDIDGTLLHNPASRADLWQETLAELGGPPTTLSESIDGFTDRRLAELYLDAAGLAADRVEEFLDVLDRLSAEHYPLHPREPVPGAMDALVLTAGAGWRNGLLTGNSPVRARTKLATAGFDLDVFDWDCFASGRFVSDRAALGRQARSLAGTGALVVLGDTAQDALAARAAGADFVAVNTDPDLLAAIADQAVLAVASLAVPAFADFVRASEPGSPQG